MDTWTVTEARQHLRELLDRADAGRRSQVTRNGEVVAIVVPARERALLEGTAPTLVEAFERFRGSVDTEDLLDDAFDDLRDTSPGRHLEL